MENPEGEKGIKSWHSEREGLGNLKGWERLHRIIKKLAKDCLTTNQKKLTIWELMRADPRRHPNKAGTEDERGTQHKNATHHSVGFSSVMASYLIVNSAPSRITWEWNLNEGLSRCGHTHVNAEKWTPVPQKSSKSS